MDEEKDDNTDDCDNRRNNQVQYSIISSHNSMRDTEKSQLTLELTGAGDIEPSIQTWRMKIKLIPLPLNELLSVIRRILDKPFRNRQHILLEIAGDRKVQDTRSA